MTIASLPDPLISGSADRAAARAKIVDVAARLLRDHGPAAVTTRAVAELAGIQAPTIYRLFGDKDGLLDAVAEHVMATFVSAKAETVKAASADDVDPLLDLRGGWNNQIAFGVANPTLFRLLSDPDRVRNSPAAVSGRRVLEARVHRLALAGLLRVSERRAVDLIQAAGIGSIQTLLATPAELRDDGLADALYEAVLAQILVDAPVADGAGESRAGGESSDRLGSRDRRAPSVQRDPTSIVVAARALAPDLSGLTSGERQLLAEWLDRAILNLQAR